MTPQITSDETDPVSAAADGQHSSSGSGPGRLESFAVAEINTDSSLGDSAQNIISPALTEGEEIKTRRASIRAIMVDDSLTPVERRKSIQGLMDGRRRSSGGMDMNNMASAAAAVATHFADFESDTARGCDDSMDIDMDGSGSDNENNPSSRKTKSIAGTCTNIIGSSSAAMLPLGYNRWGVPSGDSRLMEVNRPPCTHYQRNCTIISFCCGMPFGCRICHDDCQNLPPPIIRDDALAGKDCAHSSGANSDDGNDNCIVVNANTAFEGAHGNRKVCHLARRRSLGDSTLSEETHHTIDRFATTEIICRKCFTRQSSKSNNCIECKVQFGEYHCSICNLWMSSAEQPYHCPDCGFCRIGGRSNFKHCNDCGMCIDAQLFHDHNCKSGKYMSNCPVCQEDLFSSRSASHEMPCGHAIHWHCFRKLTSFDTRCPVCKKTAETHEVMQPIWNAMATGIALQSVPPDLSRVVTIICNDCEVKETGRRWHFLGVQCRNCTSFNTTIDSTELVGLEAAAFLDANDDGYRNQGGNIGVGVRNSPLANNMAAPFAVNVPVSTTQSRQNYANEEHIRVPDNFFDGHDTASLTFGNSNETSQALSNLDLFYEYVDENDAGSGRDSSQ